jgi:hypothetical protein
LQTRVSRGQGHASLRGTAEGCRAWVGHPGNSIVTVDLDGFTPKSVHAFFKKTSSSSRITGSPSCLTQATRRVSPVYSHCEVEFVNSTGLRYCLFISEHITLSLVKLRTRVQDDWVTVEVPHTCTEDAAHKMKEMAAPLATSPVVFNASAAWSYTCRYLACLIDTDRRANATCSEVAATILSGLPAVRDLGDARRVTPDNLARVLTALSTS